MEIRHTLVPAVLGLLTLTATASAQPPDSMEGIIRVEEDWVVYIRNPDSGTTAPQIAHVIAPQESTSGPFGMIELNHSSQPSFNGGGLQVQAWQGDILAQHHRSVEVGLIRNNYDKMTYTVGMEVAGSGILFEIRDGKSRSWNQFARDGVAAAVSVPSPSLKDYNPEFSVAQTTINVGAHRVDVMAMVEARYYSADGLEATDKTPRLLHRFREVVQFVSLQEYEANMEEYNIVISDQ